MYLLTANILADTDWAAEESQLAAYMPPCWCCWCWGIVMQFFSLVDVFLLPVIPQEDIGPPKGRHATWLAIYLGAKQEYLV